MKASNLTKILISTALVAGAFLTQAAQADDSRGNPYLRGYGPHAEHFQPAAGPNNFRYGDGRTERYVDQRQAEQYWRIHQGVRSGELTPFEAQRLWGEQRNIDRMQRQFAADGRLSPWERQRLASELNASSYDIWAEKHDAQTTYDFRPPWWFGYR